MANVPAGRYGGTQTSPVPAACDGAPGHFTGRTLVVLQLAAKGHAAEHIAALSGLAVAEVRDAQGSAIGVLGGPTLREAIAEAQRRGLIL